MIVRTGVTCFRTEGAIVPKIFNTFQNKHMGDGIWPVVRDEVLVMRWCNGAPTTFQTRGVDGIFNGCI